ncbi:unnamed protein product, partial [Discosporangium mesarthrocarpum]
MRSAMPQSRLLVISCQGGLDSYVAHLRLLKERVDATVARFAEEFVELLSPEDFGFVDPLGGEEDNETREEHPSHDQRNGDEQEEPKGMNGEIEARESVNGAEGKVRTGTPPQPKQMNVEEPVWDQAGDHIPLPPWKDLSEAEMWALDDRQREDHCNQKDRRHRTMYDRARRLVSRLSNLLELLEERGSEVINTESADGSSALIPTNILARSIIARSEVAGADASQAATSKDASSEDGAKEAAQAGEIQPTDPYTEFHKDLEASVLKEFASWVPAGGEEDGEKGQTWERDGASSFRDGDAGSIGSESKISKGTGSRGRQRTGVSELDSSSTGPTPRDRQGGTMLRQEEQEGEGNLTEGPSRIFDIPMSTSFGMISDQSDFGSDLQVTVKATLDVVPDPEVPVPDPKDLPIPEERIRQVVRRPGPRGQRPPLSRVDILPVEEKAFSPAPSDAEPEVSNGKVLQGWEREGEEEKSPSGALEGNPYRWVIRAGETIRFVVKFSSSAVGVYDVPLLFETVGTGRQHTLHVSGDCTFPSINSDPRGVFMHRIKHRPEGALPPVQKRFVMSRGTYEFGPLLIWKKSEHRHGPKPLLEDERSSAGDKVLAKFKAKEEAHAALVSTNAETFRITNNGRFPARVALAFEQPHAKRPEAEMEESAQASTTSPLSTAEGEAPSKKKVLLTEGEELGNSEGQAILKSVFIAEPEALALAVGETGEVRVWAFPTEAKTYKDTLIACVTDNPRPVMFPISCSGVVPRVTLEGPWEEALAHERGILEELNNQVKATRPHWIATTCNVERGNHKAYIAQVEAKVHELEEAGNVLDFDRLLLGRLESREFYVRNACGVACSWRLNASEVEGLDEFRVLPSPPEGVLEVGAVARVTVMFSAGKEGVFKPCLRLEYCDTEVGFGPGGESRVEREEIRVLAESYRINAIAFETEEEAAAAEAEASLMEVGGAEIPELQAGMENGGTTGQGDPGEAGMLPRARNNDGSLDFGRCRVGDTRVEKFTLRNRGKYSIAFAFRIRRATTAALFTVEPSQGIVQPGEVTEITVNFCSKAETHLKDNRDIRCVITEPHTGEAVDDFSVSVSTVSTWSHFRLQPSRGLNFGPIAFNAGTSTKTFDLKNEGDFEFVFIVQGKGREDPLYEAALRAATPKALLPEGEAETPPLETASATSDKGKGGKGTKGVVGRKGSTRGSISVPKVPDGPLTLGRFEVTPSGGLVQPGQSVSIRVDYSPQKANAHQETICIKVSGANPSDVVCTLAASYEFLGESCIPGIQTKDWRSIFEEQSVIPSLADALGGGQRGGGDGYPSVVVGGIGGSTGAGVCFAEEEKMFMFGSVVSSQTPAGVCERFKITNNNKIPCTVTFAIKPATSPGSTAAAGATASPPPSAGKGSKGGKGGGDAGADGGGLNLEADITAFSVQPEMWEIPPHEHRYVSGYFRPTEMRSYRARFEATVADNDSEPSTGRLQFLLSGKGTMPTVTLEKPLVRDNTGAVMMDFGEVSVRKSRRLPMILRNDGIVPVSCLFELELPESQREGGEGEGGVKGSGSVAGESSPLRRRDRGRERDRDKAKGHFLFAAAGGSVTLQPKA